MNRPYGSKIHILLDYYMANLLKLLCIKGGKTPGDSVSPGVFLKGIEAGKARIIFP